MFHNIPQSILDRMAHLEKINAEDQVSGKQMLQCLRQIPPETGELIALLAASAPEGQYVEIGTSAGYSTLWLALACRAAGKSITTFEILDEKAKLARETFSLTNVNDVVTFVHGDALEHLPNCKNVAFCFLDAEKEIYSECYETIVPNMVPGGILVADNAISHENSLRPMLNRALTDNRLDSLIVPIGCGVLLSRIVDRV
ncbi:O-methyltransferase [bacterium]|nr:O-methyltransferase [bacterium]